MSRWQLPNQLREVFSVTSLVQRFSRALSGTSQVLSAPAKPIVLAFAEVPSVNSLRFDASLLLALRAGVLRRAVSLSGGGAGNTGMGALAEHGGCKANIIRQSNLHAQPSSSVRGNRVRPNPSLNRTLHSLSAFGLQKPSPNAANLFRAG